MSIYFNPLNHQYIRISITKIKPCHAPLPKIHGDEVATRVGDVYMREKYLTYIC